MTEQVRTARVAGAWYLGLAVTGILGFLLVRPAIYVEGDAAATLANLQDKEALAHLGVMLEMGIVVTQALAAIWFYKLFRDVRKVAGVSVAAFGLINAVAIMASAVFLATAVAVAQEARSHQPATQPRLSGCSISSAPTPGGSAPCSSACGSSRWDGQRSRRHASPEHWGGSWSSAAPATCSAASSTTASQPARAPGRSTDLPGVDR